MVFAVKKLMRNASSTKRRIAQGDVERKDTPPSFDNFKITIRTARLNWLVGGPKTLADTGTRSRTRRTLTLPRGTSGNGTTTTVEMHP